MTIEKIIYRPIDSLHARDMALIHSKAFPNFFLTSLGKNFLETYYLACLKSPVSYCLGAFDKESNQLLGFCLTALESNKFHFKLVKSNLLQFLKQGLIILSNSPYHLIRLFLNFTKKKNDKDDGNYSEILSIGVDNKFKRLGIGKQLILLTVSEMHKKDISKITLTTDQIGNDYVLQFYSNLGFTTFYSFEAFKNRKMLKLVKYIELN